MLEITAVYPIFCTASRTAFARIIYYNGGVDRQAAGDAAPCSGGYAVSPDEELLFGLLAFQLGFVRTAQVRACAAAWALDPTLGLAGRLERSNALSRERREMIQALLTEAVRVHDGSAAETLDTFGGEEVVTRCYGDALQSGQLFGVADPDRASLTTVPTVEAAPKDRQAPAPRREPPSALPDDDEDLGPITAESPGRYAFGSPDSPWIASPDESHELGHGGLGRVLVVFDRHLGREIALKELLPGLSAATSEDGPLSKTALVVARFLREARVTAQLEHPNIVPVYEVGQRDDGTLYYTMKLVRGRTLTDALRDCSSLEERLALLNHFVGLCHALAYAHSRGVIHRDVKPANVMVGEFGETMVLDWGVAKVRGQRDLRSREIAREVRLFRSADAGQTVDGTAVGTPSYMSPEQAAGEVDQMDERSDVWGLGAVLYRLLSGHSPFPGDDAQEIIDRVCAGAIRPLRLLCPEAPPELVAIAEKALQRDKNKRYQTAGELAKDVEAFQQGARVGAHEYGSWELARRFAAKNKAALTGAALVLVVLMASLVLVWRAYERESAAGQMAHYHIAEALNEKAGTLAGEGRLLASRIYAAASLQHNPGNPRSVFHSPEFARRIPQSRHLLAFAASRVQRAGFSPVTGLERVMHEKEALGAGLFSPDGTLYAAGSYDRTVKLWDVATGEQVKILRGHEKPTWEVAFSPDGKRLAASCQDGKVRIWDIGTGRTLQVLTGHEQRVWGVAFSPDGRQLAATGDDGTVRTWAADTGAALLRLDDHQGPVYDVVYLAGGERLASSGRDKTIRIWDAASGAMLETWSDNDDAVWSLVLSPDGKRLASACEDGSLRIRDAASGEIEVRIRGHDDSLFGLGFSPDGHRIVSAGVDKRIKLWDAHSGALLFGVVGHRGSIWSVSFTPDGRRLASISEDKTLRLWSLAGEDRPPTLRGHEDQIWGLDFSPDGKLAVSGGFDRMVRVWDLERGVQRAALEGHSHIICETVFSPDGRHIASAGFDKVIRLWDTASGRMVRELAGHEADVFGMSFSPDGKKLASASKDLTVRLWEVQSGKTLHTMRGHDERLWQVAYSPDGRHLATTSTDRTVRLWDAEQGLLSKTLLGHSDWTSGVVFTSDGRRVASGDKSGSVILWDVASGRKLRQFEGHEHWVSKVRLSPDDRLLASASDDRTVRVWELATGEPLLVFEAGSNVVAIDFSPDGQTLAVGDVNAIKLFPLDLGVREADPGKLLAEAEQSAGMRLEGFILEPVR